MYLKSDESKTPFVLEANKGIASGEIVFEYADDYDIVLNNSSLGTIRVIPGWLSIIPPLLAIFLALVIRQVIVSLLAGIYAGAFFIYDFFNKLYGKYRSNLFSSNSPRFKESI